MLRAVEWLARQYPQAVAVASAGRRPLTYARLAEHINNVTTSLNTTGIGRDDRVAIALSNGPETVTALLAVLCCATAAPLNPTNAAAEFDFYLSELRVKALMIPAGWDSPAVRSARAQGIAVLEVSPVEKAEAGVFAMTGEDLVAPAHGGPPCGKDIALVLHTSGTTSRPKIVPLTHRNLLSSANHIRTTLGLTEKDRCMTVMPLFHIHGLMVTLSALLAGGSVYPIRFQPEQFFQCLDEFAPTWFSAVPTMHQAILRAAATHRDVIERSQLRFVRSSSAALPIRVKAELERVFNAPVIEAYGMTEAAHQMASNPLPPAERKAGSVGLAAGSQVAIMDGSGNLLPPGETGEIVIQGENVFQGYENNQEANADAFTNGWFRTGDQGFLDSEDYLFITGRLKDVINRGGEKISPREIDEVLLSHPAVEQAVGFPVAHPTLGEDVAAAVVLKSGMSAAEPEIREFVAGHVAPFKVPRQVLILDEIPKGPTGKLQRRALAEKLGLLVSDGTRPKSGTPYVAAIETVEAQLIQIWEGILAFRPIGIHDNFFEFGGDSLLAVQMLQRIEEVCGQRLLPTTLLAGPTIKHLGKVLLQQQYAERASLLVKIQPGGAKRPFFFLHGDFTGGGFYCLNLARHLGEDQPFYVLAPFGSDGRPIPSTIEEMAAGYIELIRAVEPQGPYVLGGLCHGGMVAFEMARQLQRLEQKVDLVVMVGPPSWNPPRLRLVWNLISGTGALLGLGPDERLGLLLLLRERVLCLYQLYQHVRGRLKEVAALPLGEQAGWALRLTKRTARGVASRFVAGNRHPQNPNPNGASPDEKLQESDPPNIYLRQLAAHGMTRHVFRRALARYFRRPYSGRIGIFWPIDEPVSMPGEPVLKWDQVIDRSLRWRQVVSDLEVYGLPGNYPTLVTKNVQLLADLVKASLDKTSAPQ